MAPYSPFITAEMSTCLPANDKYFVVHALIFVLICCRSGSELARDSFFELRGRPRYRTGREPSGIPEEATIVKVSDSVNPLGKKQDFSTLIDRSEKALNSSRTMILL